MAHPNLMGPQGWAKIEAQAKEEVGCGLSALKFAVESGEADNGVLTSCTSFTSKVDWYDQEIKILREKDSPKEASTSCSSYQARPPNETLHSHSECTPSQNL